MKRFLPIAMFLFAASLVFGQDNGEVGLPIPGTIGFDTAQQHLAEVSVDRFEMEGLWRVNISSDHGFVTYRLFRGGPSGREPIPAEEGMDIRDDHVLGMRVDFLRRGHASMTITPIRPIPIEGITKTVSVWAVGRSFNHELYLMVQDFHGRNFELRMGRLNFQGWQRLTVAIPPQGDDGRSGIIQRNYHYNHHMGLHITGFRVVFDPMQTVGSYFLYLDDLRAVTDLFAESARDPDDMLDGW
ncbi:MAG: flagellar filament outer layer protein FlaA [Spirochaetes bacterium]|nr:flagellar filament outer layer protein FlaA [Spirochaetota bacterium]